MTVIHIRERVTEDERAFLEAALSDRSLLLLTGAESTESFSVELTVGERWSENYGPANNHMFRIGSEGVEIARNGSIVIEAAQEMHVPHNMYGIVVPTGSLFLDRGTIIAAAKVEPSFRGRLKLRLVNTTSDRVLLKAGEKVASIIFFATETTRHQPTVEKRVVPDEKTPGPGRKLWRWLQVNKVSVIGWLVQAGAGAVMATLLIYYVLPPAPRADAPVDTDARGARSFEGAPPPAAGDSGNAAANVQQGR